MAYDLANLETDVLLQRLSRVNQNFRKRFPGLTLVRQPVHTLYGGAHLYKPGAIDKIARLAREHFDVYAATPLQLALALQLDSDGLHPKVHDTDIAFGSKAWIINSVHQRVKRKLATESIEDHRIDFEDGYGARGDDEEDGHCISAADTMAEALLAGTLTAFVGLRVKALSEEGKSRCFRTIGLFMTRLLEKTAGKMPHSFCITMPKVLSPEYVAVMCDYLTQLESTFNLPPGTIKLELMLEHVQCLFDAAGSALLPRMVAAGGGRVKCFILGTFDYTASANIASGFQSHIHPAADFARQFMITNLMGSEVAICDGITNIMPIPAHKGKELTRAQLIDNQNTVYSAWKLHFDNIMHSQSLGIYQGWDLHPTQIPLRFVSVYYFFLTGLKTATERLKTFIETAAQASMVGNTFDDAATAQGLVNFFVNGINCGALTEDEALASGISTKELEQRSFLKIIENRTRSQT